MKLVLAVLNAIVFLAEVVRRWQRERAEEKLAKAMEKAIEAEDTSQLNDTLRNG